MKKYLLPGIAAFLASLLFVHAQEEERYYPEQTRGEQAKIQTLLMDAESDLDNVPSYLQSQLYSGAEVILLRSQGRLKQAQAALDVHPEMIQNTYPWIGWPKKLREDLTATYRQIRNEFLEIEKQAAAVMKDFERLNPNSALGYRTELIGYFESLLNGIEDPELRARFETILEKIRTAIENDDLGALESAFEEAFTFINENGAQIEQPDIPVVPELPVTMENWSGYLDGLKDRLQGIKESHPDVYGKLWAKYNLLVQAVAREDETAARRLAEEIEGALKSAGAGGPEGDIPGQDNDERGQGRDETPSMNLPDRISSSQTNAENKAYVDFYNEARDDLDELSPQNQQKVASLLRKLREAIENKDWNRAREIMQQIKMIFEEEGESTPDIPGLDNNRSGGVNLNEDDRGIYYVDPETGEKIYFPADLTRPGIGREYIGGEGARLLVEEKQFLEQTGNTYQVRKGETRNWDFKIQEDPNAVDFTDEGMKSVLLISDQNGKSSFSVIDWSVTNIDTGEKIASASSGKSLPVLFTESGRYRVEVKGTTEWDSPFRIEAILNISI